jgi:adenylate cyclase
VDPSGDGGGGLTATAFSCGSCGAQSSPTAKFCSECGALVASATRSAEYKKVTVLFADVVHSMDIAAAVGAERLREIMAELVNRAAVVVQRYGGTVDKFTGDGVMAVFGAPWTNSVPATPWWYESSNGSGATCSTSWRPSRF